MRIAYKNTNIFIGSDFYRSHIFFLFKKNQLLPATFENYSIWFHPNEERRTNTAMLLKKKQKNDT